MDEITPVPWVNGAPPECRLAPTHGVEYLRGGGEGETQKNKISVDGSKELIERVEMSYSVTYYAADRNKFSE